MKKTLSILSLCTVLCFADMTDATAQDRFAYKGQWSLDLGIAPLSVADNVAIGDAVLNPFAQVFAAIFTFGLYEPEKNYDEYHMAPGLSLRANWQVNHWLSVCADLNGGWASCDRIKTKGGPVDRTDHWGSLSLVPGVRFTYLNKRHVMLFSGLSAGVGYVFADHGGEGGFLPAIEVAPFGLTFGGRVYGTAELNWGTEFGFSGRLGVGYKF